MGQADLQDIARKALGLPRFQLESWRAEPIQHAAVIETTGGLILVSGAGREGAAQRTWSAVLKIVTQPGEDCAIPDGLCYWRREALAYQSDLLASLPGPVRAPRCYRVDEHPQAAWLWLEFIPDSSGVDWTLPEYWSAARSLGEMGGAYLTRTPLPSYPWLCQSYFHSLYAEEDWWAKVTNPASPRTIWQNPRVQRVFTPPRQARVLQIWANKRHYLAAHQRLPQVLCHNDAHRRNMSLLDAGENPPRLVVLDWGFCGHGCLGSDLGELVGGSLSYFSLGDKAALDLEEAVLEGYLEGLRAAGWDGDPSLARLGYLISLALYWGGTLHCALALAQPQDDPQGAFDGHLPGWVNLADFALERADEALSLVKPLLG